MRKQDRRKPRVLMLVTNPCSPDPRVYKEARSLAKHYDVTVWGLDINGKRPLKEDRDGVHLRRVRLGPAGPLVRSLRRGRVAFPFALLVYYARSLRWLFSPCDAVHCHDLDTLPLGFLLTVFRARFLVFDAHEDFPSYIQFKRPGWLGQALLVLERSLMKRAAAVIVVGEAMRELYKSRTTQPLHVVGNWPDETFPPAMDRPVPRAVESAIKRGALIVGYLAAIHPSRIVDPLLEAASEDPSVFVLVAGGREGDPLSEAIRGKASRIPNVHYTGWLSESDLDMHLHLCDAIYYCLRGDDPNNRLSVSNTVFAALRAGKPVITTHVGDSGRSVAQFECGIVMAAATTGEILRAFALLRDHETFSRLQENALRAGRSFTWAQAEHVLLALYGSLFPAFE